jgi:uncharacterized protein (DUF1810 family)
MSSFDLQRFIDAQDHVMTQVMRELGQGEKRSHWMWFIFPQLRGLGQSDTARHYGLADREEARAYLANPVLGPRLVECTELVNQIEGKTAHQIFASPDDLKFRSCMTLFATLQSHPFEDALRIFYDGFNDPRTIELLHAA